MPKSPSQTKCQVPLMMNKVPKSLHRLKNPAPKLAFHTRRAVQHQVAIRTRCLEKAALPCAPSPVRVRRDWNSLRIPQSRPSASVRRTPFLEFLRPQDKRGRQAEARMLIFASDWPRSAPLNIPRRQAAVPIGEAGGRGQSLGRKSGDARDGPWMGPWMVAVGGLCTSGRGSVRDRVFKIHITAPTPRLAGGCVTDFLSLCVCGNEIAVSAAPYCIAFSAFSPDHRALLLHLRTLLRSGAKWSLLLFDDGVSCRHAQRLNTYSFSAILDLNLQDGETRR